MDSAINQVVGSHRPDNNIIGSSDRLITRITSRSAPGP